MSTGDFPKAYLRMSPNLDQHPDPLGMVLLLCAANRQTERGRFDAKAIVQRVVGRRRLKAMMERGDIVQLIDGRLYVDGWDEWQEGDLTVADRMRRMRQRRAAKRNAVTPRERNAVTIVLPIGEELDRLPSSAVGVRRLPPSPHGGGGRRKDGTNPRAAGTAPREEGADPRTQGTSQRQRRQAEKSGPTALGDIIEHLRIEST